MSELAQAINAAVAEELGLKVEPVEGAEDGVLGDPPAEPVMKQPVPSLDPVKLKELARAYVRGEIFTDRQCGTPQEVSMVFMVILFGGLQAVDTNTVGLVYEYLDQALPRGVNGLPMFMSMRLLNREDTQKLADFATKLAAAEQAAMSALEG